MNGRPVAVWLRGRRCAVTAVLETWRIDDEWWRQRPVSRVYYSLLLENGRVHQRGVGRAELRCIRRRVEQEEEPSP